MVEASDFILCIHRLTCWPTGIKLPQRRTASCIPSETAGLLVYC